MCVVAPGPAPSSKQRNQHAGFVTGSCTTAASSSLSLSLISVFDLSRQIRYETRPVLPLSARLFSCKNSCTSAHGSCCQERNVIKRVRERVPPLERVHLGGGEVFTRWKGEGIFRPVLRCQAPPNCKTTLMNAFSTSNVHRSNEVPPAVDPFEARSARAYAGDRCRTVFASEIAAQ